MYCLGGAEAPKAQVDKDADGTHCKDGAGGPGCLTVLMPVSPCTIASIENKVVCIGLYLNLIDLHWNILGSKKWK